MREGHGREEEEGMEISIPCTLLRHPKNWLKLTPEKCRIYPL